MRRPEWWGLCASLAAILFLNTTQISLAATSEARAAQVTPAAPDWLRTAAVQIQQAPDGNAYCHAVAAFLDCLQKDLPKSYWKDQVRYQGVNLRFPGRKQDPALWDPSFFDTYIPAQGIASEELRTNVILPGHGLPLVGIRSPSPERQQVDPFLPPCGLPCAATAVVQVDQIRGGITEITLRMYDPTYCTPGIAANLSAPLALLLNTTEKPSTLFGFLRSDAATESGLFMLEPYRPDKIPVVLVHGLNSLPRTWADVCNELRADPAIRERYQLWFYRYPTGQPVAVSAAKLRCSLNAVRAIYDSKHTNQNYNQMVMVGHSMGGLITRMMISESGNNFWNSVSDVPFEQAPLSPQDRAILQSVFFFHPQPSVKRAVFIATPHQGSRLATGFIGSIAGRLVKLTTDPGQLPDFIESLSPGVIRDQISEIPTSIDNLRPNNRFLCMLQQLPMCAPHHSIMGDRGLHRGLASSDGVVPYSSSHLPTAQSEVTVSAGHDAHNEPAAIEELRRILYEHLYCINSQRVSRATTQTRAFTRKAAAQMQ